jgi:hypothetical protein
MRCCAARSRNGPRPGLQTSSLSVGADVFEGPRRTLYGQFDRNDRVYVTTTWRF